VLYALVLGDSARSVLSGAIGAAVSYAVIRPFRQLQVPAWGLLIVSLGLCTILQNDCHWRLAITLEPFAPEQSLLVRHLWRIRHGFQLITLFVCVVAFFVLVQFLDKTPLEEPFVEFPAMRSFVAFWHRG